MFTNKKNAILILTVQQEHEIDRPEKYTDEWELLCLIKIDTEKLSNIYERIENCNSIIVTTIVRLKISSANITCQYA